MEMTKDDKFNGLELTPEQIRIAEAEGYMFVPAEPGSRHGRLVLVGKTMAKDYQYTGWGLSPEQIQILKARGFQFKTYAGQTTCAGQTADWFQDKAFDKRAERFAKRPRREQLERELIYILLVNPKLNDEAGTAHIHYPAHANIISAIDICIDNDLEPDLLNVAQTLVEGATVAAEMAAEEVADFTEAREIVMSIIREDPIPDLREFRAIVNELSRGSEH